MDIKLFFAILSSVIAIICYIPYLRDIFKHKTEPHMYTWLVWSILQIVGVMAQLKDGSGYGSLALAISALFGFTIFILSFKYGTKNIAKFDVICLFASLISILIYINIRNPVWSVIVITLIDFAGFLPTFRKAYEEPLTETPSTFAISGIANFISILALQNYSLTTVLYVASLVITDLAMLIMVLYRRKILN